MMSIIALVCPQCGGKINIDNEYEFGFCSYCGTKIILKNNEVVINLSVSQENPVTKESLFERAEIFLADENYSEAEEYFNRVLDIDPKFSKAYWGLLKSKLNVSTDGELIEKRKNIKGFAEYENAVKFGSDEEKIAYEKISDTIKSETAEINQLHIKMKKLERKEKFITFFVYLFLVALIVGGVKWYLNSDVSSFVMMAIGGIGALVGAFFKFKNIQEKEIVSKELKNKEK